MAGGIQGAGQGQAEVKSCCTPKTAWAVTAVAGLAIAAFGAVCIASLNCGGLGPIKNLMQQAAQGIGTSPIVLPIVIASIGGALTLGAILGYAHNSCKEEQVA